MDYTFPFTGCPTLYITLDDGKGRGNEKIVKGKGKAGRLCLFLGLSNGGAQMDEVPVRYVAKFSFTFLDDSC